MKITNMQYIGKIPRGINFNYPYPSKVTFDNGNSRIVHSNKDCKLLEELIYKKTNK